MNIVEFSEKIKSLDQFCRLEHRLTLDRQPLWQGGRIEVPLLQLDARVWQGLHTLKGSRTLGVGLDSLMKQKPANQEIAPYYSKVVMVANNGSQRFYRNAEAILYNHPEILGFRLNIEPSELGMTLYKKSKSLKALYITDPHGFQVFMTFLTRTAEVDH